MLHNDDDDDDDNCLAFEWDASVDGPGPSTDDKMREVMDHARWAAAAAAPQPRPAVASAMALRFVCHSNRLEECGMRDTDSTRAIRTPEADRSDGVRRAETLQTFDALQFLHGTYERARSAALTEGIVRDAHRILMRNLVPFPGHYRRGEACTVGRDGAVHWYPPCARVPNHVALCLDRYNDALLRWCGGADGAGDGAAAESLLPRFVRLAAWLVLRFLTVHPFADGNGRMARQLCAWVLRGAGAAAVPFPATIGGTRGAYIDALARCRRPDDGDAVRHRLRLRPPSALAALIVDGLWRGWRCYRRGLATAPAPTNRGALRSLAAVRHRRSPWTHKTSSRRNRERDARTKSSKTDP